MRLRKPCEHEMYDAHPWDDWGESDVFTCPGGSYATLDDLIAELQGRGLDGVVRMTYLPASEIE